MEARLIKYPYTKWDGGKEIYNYINVFCNELTLNQEDVGKYLVTEGDDFKMITEDEYQKEYNLDKNDRDKIVYGRLDEHCACRGMKFTKVVIISKTCGGIENQLNVNGAINNMGVRDTIVDGLRKIFGQYDLEIDDTQSFEVLDQIRICLENGVTYPMTVTKINDNGIQVYATKFLDIDKNFII